MLYAVLRNLATSSRQSGTKEARSTQESAVLPYYRRGGFGRQALQRSSASADDYRPQWSAFERGGLEHHSASPAHYGGDGGGGPFAPSPEERMHQVRLTRRRRFLCRDLLQEVPGLYRLPNMSLCGPLCSAPLEATLHGVTDALSVTSICSLADCLP